jgi:RND family efflux transporter MFP subunit
MIRRAEGLKSAEVNERLQKVLDLVTSIVEHEGFHAAAMAFVTRLATMLECDRVSLGSLRGRHVRVDAVSHSAEFGKQTGLVRAIGSAMDEALDQRAVVLYPAPADADPLVTRSHQELSRQHGSGEICTVPLGGNGKFVGALMLERPAGKSFVPAEVEVCETAAALVGPILDTKRAEERWLVRKAADSLADQMKKLLGPGHLIRKLVLLAVAALVVFFYFAKIDYRITAPITIEGTVQRMVAAPFNGYIKEALARPGDVVKKGDPLCILDDRDLALERFKWFTEKEQLLKQYHEALAKHERAQSRITRAKIDQAEAQLALLDEQLARTKILAPFSGVVMSGDLSQSLGAPVERGQVLFAVAPLESYRVITEIDERDIAAIRVGQRSEFLLPSMTGEVFPFVVEKITPVSTAKEGRNYFRVEARMEKYSERLLPGMEGIGKVKIDRRGLIWVWTHQIIDWLRLKLWTWWP